MPSSPSALRILTVCTGNICRSPMAEGLVRAGAQERRLNIHVASAGTLALDPKSRRGRSADPHAVTVMASRGIDIDAHRPHHLEDVDLAAADLVLGMATEHVIEIVGRVPDTFQRCFTLREFVQRAGAVGPRGADEDITEWLQRIDVGRKRNALFHHDPSMDIADPVGQSRRAFARTAAELAALVDEALDLLAGQRG